MLGMSRSVPEWAIYLQMAEAWGMPPTQIKREIPPVWINRFITYHECKVLAKDPNSIHLLGDEKDPE
jgi:hypothetical protein